MKKKIIIIYILFFLMTMTINSYGKYTIEYTKKVADIQIDRVAPIIKLQSIDNNNYDYPEYADYTNEIRIKVNINESNIKENYFDKNHVKILVGQEEINPGEYEIKPVEGNDKVKNYNIYLSKILGNGELKLKVLKGTIIDIANNVNEETIIKSKIIIDNTKPVISVRMKCLINFRIKILELII